MAAETLITPIALRQAEDVCIIDCRFDLSDPSAGERAYAQDHIPGAHYAHLDRDLAAPHIAGETGRHPLPDREQFIATVRRFGLRNNQQAVVYDAGNGAHAARLWWMLRWLGHRAVAVLEGGYAAWQQQGFSTDNSLPTTAESDFSAGDPITLEIDADSLQQTKATVTDARDRQRYLGNVEPIDPVAGHIPGAICLPFPENLEAGGGFKPETELRQRFLDAGVPADTSTVCYCGSGVTAAHNILALVTAGFPEPTLYPGSWSEWITDPDRPVATGE